MLLAPPILVFLALTPLLGGRLSALVDLEFRRAWLLWAALGLQIFLFMPGGPAWPAAHLASYALAGAFAWSNRRIPYLWLVCLGGLLNLTAITANGGTMPARPAAEAAAGLTGAGPANSAVVAHPHLAFLGDVFAIPASWPLHNVFSVGDVLLVIGAGLLIHRVTRSGGRREDDLLEVGDDMGDGQAEPRGLVDQPALEPVRPAGRERRDDELVCGEGGERVVDREQGVGVPDLAARRQAARV